MFFNTFEMVGKSVYCSAVISSNFVDHIGTWECGGEDVGLRFGEKVPSDSS